ncbi:MAG: polymer-forming cytoskeletal protein [Chlamydiota bacterium]
MALSSRAVKKKPCSNFLAVFVIFFLCGFRLLNALDQEEGEIVVIPSTAVIDQDLFLSGGSIEVAGTINGDLYVFGKQVFIDGTVNGDVLVIGGSVTISGVVSHSVRALGGQIEVSGEVERNVSIVAATVDLTPSATVGLNVVVFAGNASVACTVGKNVRLHASTARFSGKVNGNIMASTSQMRVTATAQVNGTFDYWSDDPALIDSQAIIQGKVTHHPSFFYQLFQKKWVKGFRLGSRLAGLLMNFFYSLVIGLILMRYFPKRIELAGYALSHRPIQSLITGVIVLFLLPFSCLILLITILGVPFALALLSITVVSFYTAKLLPLFWISRRFFSQWKWGSHPQLLFTIILVIYFGLTLIPFFGIVLSAAALLFGLGSIVLGKRGYGELEKKN